MFYRAQVFTLGSDVVLNTHNCSASIKVLQHTQKTYTTKNCLASANAYQNIQKFVQTEPACIFEIGFKYTAWNGKENSLSEKNVW